MLDEQQEKAQSLVNSLSHGTAHAVLRVTLLACFIGALACGYAYTQFRGLRSADAMELAQLARSLARGEGYTTRVLRPAEIRRRGPAAAADAPTPVHRDALHAPCYPVLLSLAFRAFRPRFDVADEFTLYEPEARVIIPLGLAAMAITGGLLYFLGRSLFNRRVAEVATACYFLGESVLADAISGLPLALLALWVTGAYAAAAAAAKRLRPGLPAWRAALLLVISAACCALAALSQYTLLLLTPAVALYLYWALEVPRRRWTVSLLFPILALAPTVPWFVQTFTATGHVFGLAPFTVLRDSSLFEGDAWARTLTAGLDSAQVAKSLEQKFWTGLLALYRGPVWLIAGGAMTALFAASYLYRFVRDEVHALHWALLIHLAAMAGAMGLTGDPEGLHIFIPLVLLFGTAFFMLLLDRFQLTMEVIRTPVTFLLVLLSALPLLLTLFISRPGVPYPPYYPPLIRQVSHLLGPNELLCTDIPAATAWYGDRPSLLLPRTLDDFYAIHDHAHAVSGLYLTTETGNRPYVRDLLSGSQHDWLAILNRRVPQDFPLLHGLDLPPGSAEQLFLTDRVRWRERPSP